MSSGEWLWGVAWLAVLPWVALVSWQPWDALPIVVEPATFKHWVYLGYAVGVLAWDRWLRSSPWSVCWDAGDNPGPTICAWSS